MTTDPSDKENALKINNPKEEKIQEAVEKFRDASRNLLQAFLFIEETIKEATQICVDLAELLEEDKVEPNPNQTNIFEGDSSVN